MIGFNRGELFVEMDYNTNNLKRKGGERMMYKIYYMYAAKIKEVDGVDKIIDITESRYIIAKYDSAAVWRFIKRHKDLIAKLGTGSICFFKTNRDGRHILLSLKPEI